MKRIQLRHFLLALLLLTARLGWGQGATTAAMSGTITDGKGGALPGATVVAVHTPTNTTYGAGTNADGRFNIQNMRVGGPYTVKITFVGYQDVNRGGISLTLAENFRLDAKLSDASTALTEVVVTGRQNPVINADRTGAATTVQREQIERLPTINRSFDDFTRLTPQANGQSFGGRNAGYNNITIDGALFNNSFGLSSTVGGQANAQPISLDAIDQIQVSIAPYDVRQGSFTGAGINAVTRSGTNKVSGSIYGFYRDQALVSGKVGDVDQDFPTFKLKNYGFRVGGPIVKDKLFFFVNGEEETRTDPPTGNFIANRPGVTAAPGAGSQTANVLARDLTNLSNFLATNYGYQTGGFENYSLPTFSRKATAKLDWNISGNHRASVKYNYLRSFRDIAPSNSGAIGGGFRSQSDRGLPFESAYYTINNNLHSVIAEVNSTFGSRFANNLTAGYSAFRDARDAKSSLFPLVDIGNANGLTTATSANPNNAITTFGFEPFTANNVLNTDVYQVGDNFTAFLGKHNLTVGTYNEFYKFKNGFAPNFNGAYQFNSLEDFYSSAGFAFNRTTGAVVPAAAGATRATPARFQQQFAADPAQGFPFANITAAQYGAYVQDEYSPRQNLKITLGLRADLPVITSDLAQNEDAAKLSFRNGEKINTGQLPKTAVLFSPRVGFNWDVNDDKRTQLRGGTGVFTGRVPYVWLSNQASNNGLLFGSVDTRFSAGNLFSPSVDRYRPDTRSTITSYNLAVTDTDFKFPQVWRTNLAIDHELPGGVVATLEALYTKDVNAVYHENVNLPNSTVRASGADNRPVFFNTNATGTIVNLQSSQTNAAGVYTRPATLANNRIYGAATNATGTELLGPNGFPLAPTAARPNISDAIVMRNTNEGYSYFVTAQLQKAFRNGLFLSAAYTYADSRSVNDGGSIAQSIWRDRSVSGDPNANVLSYSQFLQQHRVIGSLSYRRAFVGHLATTVSMFYEAAPAGRFSYIYSGDMNGDGQPNDLMYVPRNQGEIVLRDATFNSGTGTPTFATYTAAQQWTDLNNYIEQDEYLSKRRGSYAERNGAVRPWQNRLDVRLLQDIFTEVGENKNTLQLSIDIFNVGNLLNSEWGVFQTANRTNPLRFASYDAQNRPTYTLTYLNDPVLNGTGPTATVTPGVPLTDTFRKDLGGIASRWQAQIGVRYIFN